MDKQLNMFDGTKYDKVNQAIKLIQEFEEASIARNPLGYVVGYSGGKDSEVLVDLFIRSGVKFIVIHNHTGLDAPETVYFIRKKFKKWKEQGIDCRIYYPEKTFWQLCKEKKMLPTRTMRFCCAELKERDDIVENYTEPYPPNRTLTRESQNKELTNYFDNRVFKIKYITDYEQKDGYVVFVDESYYIGE